MTAERIRRYPGAARHAFSAALLAVGVLALYRWVLAPHVGYLQAVQRLGPVVGRVIQERQRVRGALDGKVGQWRTLRRDKAELEEGVFTVAQAKAFRRGLLPAVEETGCTVLRADFNPDAGAPRWDEPNGPVVMEVSRMILDVSGRADHVSALLRRLRDSRPRAWIDSCQCDFSGGEAGQVECSLALTLYVIVERREETLNATGRVGEPPPAPEVSEAAAGRAAALP